MSFLDTILGKIFSNGSELELQGGLDFVSPLSASVNPATKRIEVTGGLGGGSGHTIEDEGTPLVSRTSLNFAGAGVTAADSGGKTVVTIPGGASTAYVDAGDAAATALIPAAGGAPANVTKAAAAAGTATTWSKSDHKHDITTAAPGADSATLASAEGSATSLARSDHTHAIIATLPAKGTENVTVDLWPSSSGAGTVNTASSVTWDIALTSGKRYIVTADVQVDDGSGNTQYIKALSVRCQNRGGTCEILAQVVVTEVFFAGAVYTLTASISTTNLRFTLANTSGTNRPYNHITGVVGLDKP